ncbi:hypothetical protein EX30DRAFT_61584 [Ascodesmis nigricans]|uniref:Zn(2)-C6 fungal-type domain-containing protein n=1 Tax=Ascodesmis nigricans TaxID=341454 RepID=A0A4S2MUG8_9PEZI|nr:hypothetical protein EX30DRAFT_61584 [Ascodesmis nigricans]
MVNQDSFGSLLGKFEGGLRGVKPESQLYYDRSTSVSTSSSGESSSPGALASATSPTFPPWTSADSPPERPPTALQRDESPEEGLVSPKIEDEQQDVDMIAVPQLPMENKPQEVLIKRKRGRPPKYPNGPPKPLPKTSRARTKTGCLTCRKRKKKCDEAKPGCENCHKNSVVCEGYADKTVWQPGKKRRGSNDLRFSLINLPTTVERPLPILVDGVESHIDRIFLQHFTDRVAKILSLWEDDNNPFHEILLPLALQDRPLMHSLLALSGSHLLNTGFQPGYEQARLDHIIKGMQYLRESLEKKGGRAEITDSATAIVMLLDSICSGKTDGEYRSHLEGARLMMNSDLQPTGEDDPRVPLMRFVHEFFWYHDVLNSITRLDRPVLPPMQVPEYIMQPDNAALLGVLDGLFSHVSEITNLRSMIRHRKREGIRPAVNFEILNKAVAIDEGIRSWEPKQPERTPRFVAAQLYRQCTWIYLCRTVQTGQCGKIEVAVQQGLMYLNHIPEQSGTQSILLMPLFLLGCAAFAPHQRPEISERFEALQKWSGLGNINPAHEVVQEVWKYMDAGDDEKSWDWEQIFNDMEYDFLVT